MCIPVLIACLALALGAFFEVTVYPYRSGMGVGVFYLATLLACILLLGRLRRKPSAWVVGLWMASGLFALALARFDSQVVHSAGAILFWGTLVTAIFWSFAPQAPLEALARPVPGALLALVPRGLGCIVPGLRGLQGESDGHHLSRRIVTGLALSVPMLMAFGALFMASDGVYEKWLSEALELVWPSFVCSSLRVAIFSSLCLGFLTALALGDHAGFIPGRPGRAGDPVVLGVALAMLNLLFVTFLVVQARYMFGGETVLQLPGLTCADYARRGFFELVTVTVCVLGLAAFVYRSLHRHPQGGWPLALTTLLILQTGGVAASAVKRLALYTAAYGMTVARFYAAAGLAVMCVLLILVLVAAWRRADLDWLGSRMAVGILVILALLSQYDVEGLIVRTHVARCAERPDCGLDTEYVGSLSADAVLPLLSFARETRDPALRASILQALQATRARMGDDGQAWQASNLSRTRALTPLNSALQCTVPKGIPREETRPATRGSAAVPIP